MKHRVQKTDAIYQLLTFILLASMSMPVAADDFHADSATVSLLTCSGGREVYEQYGHTAIRFNNNRGTDITFNYGVFDFNTPDFVYRFIKGETDYQLGIEPFEYFRSSYARRGSEVREQVLNLTSDEKVRLFQSLCVNFQPENRIYRYNFFYDNCTTRARDMIISHLDGTVEYRDSLPPTTFREYVHGCSHDYPWTTFGIDLLLGVRADCKTTREERQFLPYNLHDDFASAIIRDSDGSERPLVKETNQLLKAGPVMTGADMPISPHTAMILFSALILLVTAIEQFWLKRIFWWFDALLMFIVGAVGIVLCALFFSKHPTVRTNLQCLLFNPLPLLMLYPVVKHLRKNQGHWWWTVQLILLILCCIGCFFQDYATGVPILACVLLYRCVTRVLLGKNTVKRGRNSE